MIKDNILLVGCGKMGSALLGGFISKLFSPDQIVIVENDPKRTYDLNRKYGVKVIGAGDSIPSGFTPETVIFAVKPQIMADILPGFARICSKDTLFISIAAGKTTAFFEKYLGVNRFVVRCMPNLPALVGQGATVLYPNDSITKEHQRRAESLFAAVGECFWVEDEGLLDAVTAISGSGPAYVFHFMECLIDAGIELGLPKKLATSLACSTIRGSAQLAKVSDETPTVLKEQVTSPKGTTEAALEVLSGEGGLSHILKKATRAAMERSKELAE